MTEQRLLSGRYRITSHLARGGMADVFKAEDELLGRRVAVKILHPQFASDEAFVARFKREAQQAAGLSHPNIVAIYDWGEDQDTYYMVMELIEGRTLRDIRRSEGPLLARHAAEIAAETAAALTVAHQAGVYHRDVKPGNIMLTPDGSVKVTDFGIARALDDSAELTRTGAVIGTATYFSPEQAQGLPADERSDVYSLGVVLYELLCGVAPFTGESPVAVAYQHVSEYAEPPSAINPDVPAQLEAIVEKAMEKDPALRYQTADDMRKDLLLHLRGETPLVMAAQNAGNGWPASDNDSTSDAATQLMPLPAATVPPDEAARSIAQVMPEQRSQTGYLVAIFGLLLALALGVFFLTRLLASEPAETLTVAVPDLTGWTKVDAFEELQQRLNLKLRERLQVSDTVPAGWVIATEPPGGSNVDPGSFVTVIVSSGPQQFAIPNVIDSTEEAARALLEAGQFVVGVVDHRFHDTIPAGVVITQSPRPGTNAPPGTVVDLEVSDGPFAFTVPDVKLVSEESALRTLEDAGIVNVEVLREFSAEILEGFVIRTEPAAGRLLANDDMLILVVSMGPEPFEVPTFVGMTVADAQRRALDLGLIFILEDETEPVTAESGLVGLVAAQTPRSGAEVVVGDEVRIRLGALIQRTVPDLIGLTEEEATTLLASIGLKLEVTGTSPVSEEDGLEGLIATQDKKVDAEVDDGSTIKVTIGIIVPPPTQPPGP